MTKSFPFSYRRVFYGISATETWAFRTRCCRALWELNVVLLAGGTGTLLCVEKVVFKVV